MCVYVVSFGLVPSPPVMVCAPEGMCVLPLCFRLLPERTDISVPFVFWHATSSYLVVVYYNMKCVNYTHIIACDIARFGI